MKNNILLKNFSKGSLKYEVCSSDYLEELNQLTLQLYNKIKKIQPDLAHIKEYKKLKKLLKDIKYSQKKLNKKNKKVKKFSDLDSFYKYATQDTQGQFYHDALHDLESTFTGGSSKLIDDAVYAPVLAMTQFKPISSDGFVKGKHPFKSLSRRVYVLPMEQINTSLPHVAISPNPFQPYELWGNSASSFIYRGNTPAYVQVTGHLSIFVKLYNVTPEQHRYSCKAPFITPELWCEFFLPVSKPKVERSFRRGLAMDTAPLGKTLFRMEDDTISLNPHPKNYHDFYQALDTWNKNQPHPIDMKKIRICPKVLVNHTLDHRLGEPVISQGCFMTDWFLLPPCLCYTTNTDGTSSIIQIQYKDTNDKIWFAPVEKNVIGANQQFFIIPAQARYARIVFGKLEDTAKKLEVTFFPKEVDPTYGMWAHYELDINTFYTFYPNTPFQIVLRFYGGNFFSVDSQSFFINSGGLQCFINVKDQLADTLTLEAK